MKKYIALFFIALLASALFAQNGYKEYSWGMGIDEVKAKCPDLTQKSEDDFYWASIFAGTYFHSDEVREIPDPQQYETQEKVRCYSESNRVAFYFVGGKLRAVSLLFAGENIRSALSEKYGAAKSIYVQNAGNAFAETVSWKDGSRIVVWSMNHIDYRATGIEKVCYIDSEWLSPLVEKSMA